jgi:hypothetical protein
MKYVRYENNAWQLQNYLQYLQENERLFPPGARDFAMQDWRYDFKHHQCPHDSWVEALIIHEPASGARREVRSVAITALLLGAYHDGRFTLTYNDVTSYEFGYSQRGRKGRQGHGDWIIDELTLSEAGAVRHEILFEDDNRWIICSGDLCYQWLAI